MKTIDSQFGPIKLHHPARTRKISIKVDLDGVLKMSAPVHYPKLALKSFIKLHQAQIKKLLDEYQAQFFYKEGDLIGKTRLLRMEIDSSIKNPKFRLKANSLTVVLNERQQFDHPEVQAELKKQVKKALKKDAKIILIPRVNFLAKKYNFEFDKIRFSHSSTRWGSCSQNRTISLNIGLVKLPNQLIDYVIVHELCHLRQMNHSPAFWHEVEQILPDYKKLRQQLKKHSPHL